MSHIRLHPKTGLFQYRRAIPERLRGHVPHVDGFSENSSRIEFTRSLGTNRKADANRLAARLDMAVEIALTEAEKAAGAAEPAPAMPINRALRSGEAFQLIEAWRRPNGPKPGRGCSTGMADAFFGDPGRC